MAAVNLNQWLRIFQPPRKPLTVSHLGNEPGRALEVRDVFMTTFVAVPLPFCLSSTGTRRRPPCSKRWFG